MLKSRRSVTLLALLLSAATLPFAALAADVCENPTFRFAQGSPFKLKPKPGVDTEPKALAAGTYVVRPVQTACNCDLAVGLKSKNDPTQGFLALLRGNDDGTFTGTPDGLRQLDGTPVAIATGRFRTDAPVDGIVVVTSPGTGNGQVQVFFADATGTYPQSPTAVFPVGPNPAAIATGDFDGDGQLDVAIINTDNSSLTILLGKEGGTFQPTSFTISNLGGSPESLTAGRFSGGSEADDIAIGVVQNVSGARQVGIVIVPGSRAKQFAPKPVIAVGQRGSFGPSIAAVNLSGPSGPSGRRARDLAIAFSDRTPAGDAVGRVKVLLGRDGGGFGDVAAAQTFDIGATAPQSIKVADLDDDGAVDLIVAAFPQSGDPTGGTIHFFQGHAAPGANVGFQVNPRWFTIPATSGIRPRALVAARFGNHNPAEPIASMGIAAINAPDLNSIAVFQGNGRGSFVEPKLVTTLLGEDDRLFVSGDFHSGGGNEALQDLAFITKTDGQNVLRVLLATGAGSFAPPDPGQPPLLAGNSPSLMAAGQFAANGPTALAVVDDTGALGQQPLLKIFFGQGNGLFSPGPELPLNNAGRPRAIATGRFRGPNMPLDIALVGDTTPFGTTTAFSGKLTLLFNDGQGGFTVGVSHPLGFAPGALATSSRLSASGLPDYLIRDAHANRFLFLINIGRGGVRVPIGPNQGLFEGAGNFNALLAGNVAHSGPSPLDDVVTFDSDMTLKIFVNNGRESFTLRTIAPGGDPHFSGAQPPYLLADFGSGTLALAAPVARAGRISLLLLQGDGAGGFRPSTGQVPLEAVRGVATNTFKTKFIQTSGTPAGFSAGDIEIRQTVVAQFRSVLHGNSKPDFAFITKATETGRTAGNCAGDTQRPPPPAPLRHDEVCPTKNTNPADCGGPSKTPCFDPPCCHCNDRKIPVKSRCPATCDFPEPITPFAAVCERASTFTPAMTVFGNTCGD